MDGGRPRLDGPHVTRKYDELAGRLAQRLTASPARGTTGERATAPPVRSPAPGDAHDDRDHDRDHDRDDDHDLDHHLDGRTSADRWAGASIAATVRRGHLVPTDLHARARRAKVARAVGTRLSWSDVMIEGVGRLLDHPDTIVLLDTVRADADAPKRLIQATLPVELDRRFAERRLDIDERVDRRITYELLWAAAVELWIAT
jgi:hypothetical protein